MKIEVGTAYYPEAWPQERVQRDVMLMKQAGIRLVRIGEFAWSHMERPEGVYSFDWLHAAMRMFEAADIRVILCTPTSTAPAWLVKKHPEIMIRHLKGDHAYFGVRDHTCYTSRVYREYAERLIERMAREMTPYQNIAGWQLDNEIGHTIFGDCHCEVCQREFRGFLQRRYGTLEALNRAWFQTFWSTEYSDWDEVELGDVECRMDGARVLDSIRFRNEEVEGFIAGQIAAIRRILPEAKVGLNNYSGKFDRSRASRMVDFIGPDVYPSPDGDPARRSFLLDSYRGLRPDESGWILESSTAPGLPFENDFKFYLWSFIARGFDHLVYFHWRSHLGGFEKSHGTFLGPGGEPRGRYRVLAETTRELDGILEPYPHLPAPDAPVAVMYDFEASWGYSAGFFARFNEFGQMISAVHSGLFGSGVTSNVIAEHEDFSRYRLLILPLQPHVSKELGGRLKEFVRSGGVLLAFGETAMADGNTKQLPESGPEHLQDLFGITIAEGIPFAADPGEAPGDNAEPRECAAAGQVVFGGMLDGTSCTGSAGLWVADVEATDAEVHLFFKNTVYAGQPFFTEKAFGKGRALYCAANRVDSISLRRLLECVASRASVAFGEYDPELEMTTRGSLKFFFNHGKKSKTIPWDGTGRVIAGEVGANRELASRGFCVIDGEK